MFFLNLFRSYGGKKILTLGRAVSIVGGYLSARRFVKDALQERMRSLGGLVQVGVAAAMLFTITSIASGSGIQVIPQTGWILPETITPVSSFGALQNSLLIPDFEKGYLYSLPVSGGAFSIFATLGTPSSYLGGLTTGAALGGLLIDSGPLAGNYLAFGSNATDPANGVYSGAIFAVAPSGASQVVFQSPVTATTASGNNFGIPIIAPTGFGQLGGKILVTQESDSTIKVVTPTSGTAVTVSTFATLPIEPIGLVAAPPGFGSFAGRLLVGSAGTGTIVAVDSQGNVTNFANPPLASGASGLRQMIFAPAGFGSYGGDLLVSVAAKENGGGNTGQVYVLNSAGSLVAVLNATTVGIPFDPRGLYFPNSSQLYISNASSQPGLVIATASDFTPVSNGDLTTVAITTPSAGATVSGSSVTLAANATAGMGLTIVGVQMQVDGTNLGPVLTALPYSTTLDSTTLTNGSHSLTALVVDSGGNSVISPIVPIIVNNTSTLPPSLALITGFSLGPLRNNYSGFLGMEFTVGTTPIAVTSLGRIHITGNGSNHLVKLVQASTGIDVPGGSVSVNASSGTPGQFTYASLATPVVLAPNTSYYLVSAETAGSDSWSDIAPVAATAASVIAPVYYDGSKYVPVSGYGSQSYVPVNLLYVTAANPPVVTFTSPPPSQSGMFFSGSALPLTVTATAAAGLTITGVQFKIDGANIGNSITSPPYSVALDTTKFLNGVHVLTAVATDSRGVPASASYPLIFINNPPPTTGTPLLTAFSNGVLRNDYTGYVGAELKVGSSPISVTALGRIFISQNAQLHTVKLVNAATGIDVPNASVTVTSYAGTPGQFSYINLPAPVTLAANSYYYLVSSETAGGDQWYNITSVTSSSAASVVAPAYFNGSNYVAVAGSAGQSYVPVNLLYTPLTSNPLNGTSLVTSYMSNTLRNNFSGYVGMQIQVGPTPLTITALGRIYLPGNAGTHVMKIVTAGAGTDLPGSSVTVSFTSAVAGQFAYTALPTPLTLSANTVYYLLSNETAAGDQWYDYTGVTATSAASISGPVYFNGSSYQLVGFAANKGYVPVSFLYY